MLGRESENASFGECAFDVIVLNYHVFFEHFDSEILAGRLELSQHNLDKSFIRAALLLLKSKFCNGYKGRQNKTKQNKNTHFSKTAFAEYFYKVKVVDVDSLSIAN